MDTAAVMATMVERAVLRVDEVLAAMGDREMYGVDEVRDLLLDLRQDLTT